MEVSPSCTDDMVGPQSEVVIPFRTSPPLNRSGSMQISTSDDVLNKNYNFEHFRRQSVPPDTARKLFTDQDDSTSLNSTKKPARNIGYFDFKHADTDDGNTESEQDEGLMDMDTKNVEESSEEEWTYKCGEDEVEIGQNEESSLCQSTETLSPVSVAKTRQETLPRDKLQELIDGAEQIASPIRKPREFLPLLFDSSRPMNKVSRWMRDFDSEDGKTQGESCDASGEYTTEEEERHSSGDFNTSVIHCHQSSEVLPALESPVLEKALPSNVISNSPDLFNASPVVLRVKRKEGTPKRPLSESGLPQLLLNEDKLLQSRSESALNQIDRTPTQSVKMDTSVHGTLSSSTTVEEIHCHTQEGSGGGYSTNSLRRRKTKHRKRVQGRKSDSGSDNRDPPSPLKSAPVIRRVPTSGTETEEEREGESKLRATHRTRPNFRIGIAGGPVTTLRPHCGEKALSAESSWSEQAWDNYQDNYVSETYSEEIADQETTRKLLEFGDDYRNYMDSNSDGASSLGLNHQYYSNMKNGHRTRERRRRPMDRESPVDSDSCESQEIGNLISKSMSQLLYCEQVWATILAEANPHLVLAKDFAEIISTCNGSIKILKSTLERYSDLIVFAEECQKIKGLIERWETLETKSEQLQKMRSLQREMAALKEELLDLNQRVTSVENYDLQDREQLDKKIFQIKGEQANLRERKSQLIEVNTAVHKFFTDSGQQEAAVRLKDDVKDLYFIWEETNERVSHQLESLTQLSAAWQTFESHLSELQVALRGDHNTLRMLDCALQEGPVSQDVCSSVIDVAKVLSEKQDLCFQSVCALNSTTPGTLSLPTSTEGSLSDSGISDSGSEQESERERRLSALRRLARQLEGLLSPNSQAFLDMARRIEQTENELRGLQKTCRELIVRTAACADARVERQDSPPLQPGSTLINRSKKTKSTSVGSGPQSFMELDPDDDPDPGKTGAGWLWRVIRAALPFQMAILAIFCVACLLEPHCCDSMNNLNFSLTPQLRYMRGPPPV